MMPPIRVLLCALSISVPLHLSARADSGALLEQYADVLDMRGQPRSARDASLNVFFDQGAWHGYSLHELPEQRFGFAGPFLLERNGGTWTARRFAQLELEPLRADEASRRYLEVRSRALPGRLVQEGSVDGIDVRQTLIFFDSRTALVRIELQSLKEQRVRVAVRGAGRLDEVSWSAVNGGVIATFASGPAQVRTRLLGVDARAEIDANGDGYRLLVNDVLVPAGRRIELFLAQSIVQSDSAELSLPDDPAATFADNAARWNGYLAALLKDGQLAAGERYAGIAVKAVETLIGNWRSARADLTRDGLFPSYSTSDFHGFWAWDSWKHAVALAQFAPDLAREQILTMFDHQNAAGMVPDVVYANGKENNWRDTKPPLAAWAAWAVYEASQDRAFLEALLPKLVRYHRWWYANRDHDTDGLAEYGSTDGTRIAAAWESGMDNAVRFDKAAMVRNGAEAWSLDQESVDLNSYLYFEKLRLADIAEALNDQAVARSFRKEAEALGVKVRERMFDRDSGYFHDIALRGGAPVRVMGPEGWIPLWAGLATEEQARSVARVMLDPAKFATRMPFPTLAADHPEFSPVRGYWRGPVWIDQAYFAIEALRRYGFEREAGAMRARLLENAVGLIGTAPFYENYDPLSGAGVQSRNFSWSAAHYLLLTLGR